MNVPILYAIAACVICLALGSVFGVLWGRKHPKLIETVVSDAKQAGAASQAIASKGK